MEPRVSIEQNIYNLTVCDVRTSNFQENVVKREDLITLFHNVSFEDDYDKEYRLDILIFQGEGGFKKLYVLYLRDQYDSESQTFLQDEKIISVTSNWFDFTENETGYIDCFDGDLSQDNRLKLHTVFNLKGEVQNDTILFLPAGRSRRPVIGLLPRRSEELLNWESLWNEIMGNASSSIKSNASNAFSEVASILIKQKAKDREGKEYLHQILRAHQYFRQEAHPVVMVIMYREMLNEAKLQWSKRPIIFEHERVSFELAQNLERMMCSDDLQLKIFLASKFDPKEQATQNAFFRRDIFQRLRLEMDAYTGKKNDISEITFYELKAFITNFPRSSGSTFEAGFLHPDVNQRGDVEKISLHKELDIQKKSVSFALEACVNERSQEILRSKPRESRTYHEEYTNLQEILRGMKYIQHRMGHGDTLQTAVRSLGYSWDTIKDLKYAGPGQWNGDGIPLKLMDECLDLVTETYEDVKFAEAFEKLTEYQFLPRNLDPHLRNRKVQTQL